MKIALFRPDGFAIGLFAFGLVMFFVPLMVMPGLTAIIAAFGYWIIMTIAKFLHHRGI